MEFRGLDKAKQTHKELINYINRKEFTIKWKEYNEKLDSYITQERSFKASGINEAKEYISKFYELDNFEVYDNKGTKLFTEEDI